MKLVAGNEAGFCKETDLAREYLLPAGLPSLVYLTYVLHFKYCGGEL